MQKPAHKQGRIAKFDSKFRKFTCAQAVAVGDIAFDSFSGWGHGPVGFEQ